ncbi:MAG: SDR family oxidoreductase, partial [Armatimonadota bacterium]
AFGQIAHDAAVNAYAPLALSRAFASQRVTGRIVNVLDARIRTYDWSHVAYILSKHMLAVLTRMTALDFAPDVTVNAVAPGLILPPPGEDEGYLKRCAESLPLKRHGDTEDVADAVVFLARSNFITGQVIYVDGGHHLRSGCAD